MLTRVVTVADKIRALRSALQLSQETVAERGGFPRPMASKIETGQNQVSTALMRDRLARGLGVNARDLGSYIDGQLSLDELLTRHRKPLAQQTDELPEALSTVLQSSEGSRWGALTLGALRGAATASREPRTEEQWLILGRAYEMGALAAGRVIDDDPIEARRAERAKRRNG